jgi:hypothetical protein
MSGPKRALMCTQTTQTEPTEGCRALCRRARRALSKGGGCARPRTACAGGCHRRGEGLRARSARACSAEPCRRRTHVHTRGAASPLTPGVAFMAPEAWESAHSNRSACMCSWSLNDPKKGHHTDRPKYGPTHGDMRVPRLARIPRDTAPPSHSRVHLWSNSHASHAQVALSLAPPDTPSWHELCSATHTPSPSSLSTHGL